METEFEATFTNINKNKVRDKLKKLGAKLIKPEFFMKRTTFNLPKQNPHQGGDTWARVRDEGDKITMSFKMITGNEIHHQKEICLKIDDYDKAVSFLNAIGCDQKAYQETKREIWMYKNVEICLDEWPYLEPFIEIEGESEEIVKKISEELGFDYKKALFCAVDILYENKYGVPKEIIDNDIPRITFSDPNPFLKK